MTELDTDGRSENTLCVRLESAEEFYARLGKGDRDALSIRSEEELGRLLAPSHLRILRVVSDQHPTTAAAVADTLGRDQEKVEHVLGILAQYDLLDLVDHAGEIRPIPQYDTLEITVPL
ncbi:hypothetical protein [Haloarchaeobius sp. TZWWS8]|uniref:HVO_A0114 family putative DNA-binding protein n=1 Tax=Haloarchaeobius sp. TZWWS8 TaxID=3446121 RepID=UPI003EC04CE3